MKQWDVFISHASEDKETIAIPLAEALHRAGLKVWLDQIEITIGDSLREKIDEGLAKSRFGIVILSPEFLRKGWTRRELNGLMAIEEDRGKVILPVWHQIDKATLTQYSPILADRTAANTAQGITAVASQILQVVLHPDSQSPATVAPTIGRRLIELLDRSTNTTDIKHFLSFHQEIIARAFGGDNKTIFKWSPGLGSITPDLCIGSLIATTSRRSWHIVKLGPANERLFEGSSKPVPLLEQDVVQLESLRQWIQMNLRAAREILPDVKPDFQGVVLMGRRDRLSKTDVEFLREYNDCLLGIRVRTYDWLIDVAANL
jgi:hypothetical protein